LAASTVVVFELLPLWSRLTGIPLTRGLAIAVEATTLSVSNVTPGWLFALGLFIAAYLPAGRPRTALAVAASAGIGAVHYRLLALYAPTVAGLGPKLSVFTAWCAMAAALAFAPRLPVRARVALALASIGGFLACGTINAAVWLNQYPSFHGGVFCAGLGLLGAGLGALTREPAAARPLLRAGLVAWFVVALFAGAWGIDRDARVTPTARALSHGGQLRSMLEPYQEPATEGSVTVSQPEAVFARHSGLPTLPEGFSVDDHNVLLVVVEAVRFDETSLAAHEDEVRANTPRLLEHAQRAGVSFRSAYSPSTATLYSMAGLLALSVPSSLHVTTWRRPWLGELHGDERTAAEVFHDEGRATFWIGHNHSELMGRGIVGLEQGFAEVDRVTSEKKSITADRYIVDKAIARLDALGEAGERFFGLVFLVSPHTHYVAHYDEMPAENGRDLYRQEVRYADSQVGRLLDALARSGRFEDTVVIVTSDHGEEHRDHGGVAHSSTVYDEVSHVPMVLFAPGFAPAVSAAPTSTGYVLPWLMLTSRGGARAAALERVSTVFAPFMDAVDGAVIVELTRADRALVSLVNERTKLNADLAAGYISLFDRASDPGEMRDLFLVDDKRASDAQRRLANYQRVRAGLARYGFDPSRKPPPREPEAP
jgi:arylsulfatase A-like enzyme